MTLLDAPSLSPCGRWLAHHGLRLTHKRSGWVRVEGRGKTYGVGKTEHDATCDFATKAGIQHYTIDGWELQMPFEEEPRKRGYKEKARRWQEAAEGLYAALGATPIDVTAKIAALAEYERAKEELG